MRSVITNTLTKGVLNRLLFSLTLLLAVCANARTPNDTTDRNWWHLLKEGDLSLQDSTVQYPKFIRFCLNVYNWGDKTFNTYDPEYVVGTGHNWKARLVNDNWSDSYTMRYRGQDLDIRMLSNLNVNLGAYIHFMAVSVGYSVNMNTLFGGKPRETSRFDTNFNCALFNLDLYSYQNEAGTYIRHFTGYQDNQIVRVYFPGVKMRDFGVSGYYFFNHGKYSQGAAYNFSKIQKKSAGSWLLGLSYSNLDVNMDFSQLDKDLLDLYTFGASKLKFHYYNFSLLGGYGYNWVLHPQWLFNITIMPQLGVTRSLEDSTDGQTAQFGANIHARTSVTFNHKSFFASVIGKFNGNWYTSRSVYLFNAVEYFSANLGVRF